MINKDELKNKMSEKFSEGKDNFKENTILGKDKEEKGNIIKKRYHAVERKAFGAFIDWLLKKIRNADDKREFYLKALDKISWFYKKDDYQHLLERTRKAIEDPDHRWVNFISEIIDETDPNVLKTFFLNVGYEEFLRGMSTIRKNREKYNCNIPYVVLFDPTNACNMHCEGCWSGTYGKKDNLSYEMMDKIVTQSKELGTHMFMMTGGEPMVRRKDIFRLAEKHYDCEFVMYTNSTFINDEICQKCVELGNIAFMVSIEGTPETNDDRRGDGHYATVMNAMELLKKYGIIFGTSVCYTKYNIDAVTSDEFFNLISSKGARLGFFFHYMPVGANAVLDLLPTPEQRKYMYDRIRYIRTPECKIKFFPMDFQNDGEFIGGCIAGGREYFHINAAGYAEPCVFIHYADANIHDHSILEILQSPLFMAYRQGQPFNENHLRPCPMLENPQMLKDLVHRTNAVDTNNESSESVDDLCNKCKDYADAWKPVADEIWETHDHWHAAYKDNNKVHVVYGEEELKKEALSKEKVSKKVAKADKE